MGVAFCCAGMCSFAALYILWSRSQKRQADPHGMTLVVFVTGFALSLLHAEAFAAAQYPARLVTLGTLMGIAAGVGTFGTALSAHARAPASVINTVAGLAITIPIVLALVLFHQIPRGMQWAGLTLAVVAIVLLQGVTEGGGQAVSAGRRAAQAFYLMLMFAGNGVAQFLQARLHHEGLDALQAPALTMMYLAGAVCAAVALPAFRGKVNAGAVRYGCAVGLMSFLGNRSMLLALATLPASVVFPLVVCGPIVLTTLYARLVEGARLSRRQAWGLASGGVALLMLTLG